MKYIHYLSYALEDIIPTYGNTKGRLQIIAKKEITRGDSCNTYGITLQNHWGTHIDAPAHFFRSGKNISSYKPGYWHFRHPYVINVPLKKGRIIKLKDFSNKKIDKRNDAVLIKTYFYKLKLY